MALASGISDFNDDLMRFSICEELKKHEIPEANLRRTHYKHINHKERLAMDNLSDCIKPTHPAEFNNFPNYIINSFVKMVISSDDSNAKSKIRKKELCVSSSSIQPGPNPGML